MMWELPENSNLTLSAPPDRTEFETFRMGGRTQPLCLLHRAFAEDAWQRRRSRGASFSSGSSQISDESYDDTDVSMPELASSDVRLTPSSNCSDFAMTDIKKIVSQAGQSSSEPLSNFQLQAMFPVWGSMMTGSARSSSDAPVCPSLERPASTKTRPADKRKCNYLCSLFLTTTGSMAKVAATEFAWRARPVSPRASGGQLVAATLWIAAPPGFFLSSDRFLFSNDRAFLSMTSSGGCALSAHTVSRTRSQIFGSGIWMWLGTIASSSWTGTSASSGTILARGFAHTECAIAMFQATLNY